MPTHGKLDPYDESEDWIQYVERLEQGRIHNFKLGGARAYLKKLRRAEGGANIFGVFRVKNHDFTPKKSYFFQLRREARKLLGYFV
jgi:hypothetical protein